MPARAERRPPVGRAQRESDTLTGPRLDICSVKWYHTGMAALVVPDTPASPLSTVVQALAAIDQAGPERLATGALRPDLRWFATQQRALEAMSAHWRVAER